MGKQVKQGQAGNKSSGRRKEKSVKIIKMAQLLTPQLRTLISAKWKDVQQQNILRRSSTFENKDTQNLLNFMTEDMLNCPICLELCVYPVATECGHTFCLPCFEKMSQKVSRCCVCRTPFTGGEYYVSLFHKFSFQNYVRTKIDWSQAETYWIRVREIDLEEAKRAISENIRIGDMVDVWVRGKWIEGKVIGVEKTIIDVMCYTLESRGQGQLAEIERKSRCLARHNAFTTPPKVKFEIKKKQLFFRQEEIPQIREYPPAPVWTNLQLEGIINGSIQRSSWDEDFFPVRQPNSIISLMEQSQHLNLNFDFDIWSNNLFENEDNANRNFDN